MFGLKHHGHRGGRALPRTLGIAGEYSSAVVFCWLQMTHDGVVSLQFWGNGEQRLRFSKWNGTPLRNCDKEPQDPLPRAQCNGWCGCAVGPPGLGSATSTLVWLGGPQSTVRTPQLEDIPLEDFDLAQWRIRRQKTGHWTDDPGPPKPPAQPPIRDPATLCPMKRT